MLYQGQSVEGASEPPAFEMPRLAVVSADENLDVSVLLKKDSLLSYKYKELCGTEYSDLSEEQRAYFDPQVRALKSMAESEEPYEQERYDQEVQEYREMIEKHEKHIYETFPDTMAIAEAMLAEATSIQDIARQTSLSHNSAPEEEAAFSSEVAFNRVKQRLYEEVGNTFKEKSDVFVGPAVLSDDQEIFESLDLEVINKIFTLPQKQRSRFGFEKKIPGGVIGERSWVVASDVPTALELERQKIAEQLERLYVPLLAVKSEA